MISNKRHSVKEEVKRKYHIQANLRPGSRNQLYLATEMHLFNEATHNTALNVLVYGVDVIIHYPNEVTFISKQVRSILNLADPYRIISINLFDLQFLSEDPSFVPRPPCEPRKAENFLTFWLQGETLHLEFNDNKTRDLIHQAIQHTLLAESYNIQFTRNRNQIKFAKLQLQQLPVTRMNVKEIQMYLKHIRVRFDLPTVQFLFLETEQTVPVGEVWRLILRYFVKEEVRPLFEMYVQQSVQDDFSGSMKMEQFNDFLVEEQNEYFSADELLALLYKLKEGDPPKECQQDTLSFVNFSEYLHSSLNEIALPQEDDEDGLLQVALEISQNLPLALTDYYVNAAYQPLHYSFSSQRFQVMEGYHNLPEGVQPIAYALLRGVKYLQLDLWTGMNGQPVCIYGHMQTFQINVRDVMDCIKKLAFIRSPLPLILSIEDHCGVDLAQKVTDIILDELGSYVELAAGNLLSDHLNKIILTGPVNILEPIEDKDVPNADDAISVKALRVQQFQDCNNVMSEKLTKMHHRKAQMSNMSFRPEPIISNSSIIAPTLLRDRFSLKGIQHEFRMFEVPSAHRIKDKLIILETQEKYMELRPTKDFEESYEQDDPPKSDQLTKMYPKSRYHNADPSISFRYGIQITLMFHHIIDYNYLFYYALMGGHDGIIKGYVQKRQPPLAKQQLRMQLLSGRQLNRNLKGDTLVQVHNHQNNQIFIRDVYATNVQQGMVTCKANTFNPQFDAEFTFAISGHNSVLMVVVYIDEVMTAWNAIRCDRIRQGFRFLPLLDTELNRCQGTGLFAHLKIV